MAAENGEILRTNKSAVAHWVDGARPSGRTAQYLVEALSRRTARQVSLAEIGLATDTPQETCRDDDPVAALADLVHLDRGRNPLADAVFTVPGFTLAAVAAPLTYDHDAVSRMLRARATLSAIGTAEIEVVQDITTAFAAADERLGGGHGLTTVIAYLADTAAPMLRARFRSESMRRQAFAAVSELAYLAGWKHHDLGHPGTAQRYYLAGYQLACESDPRGHAAWMTRALAHQALSLKQPRHCADLIAHALTRGVGHLDGQTEALLHVTRARAHAQRGEPAAASRSLLAAENALTRTDRPQPSFSAIAGPASATVASHTARALTELGDHTGAHAQHHVALQRWAPDTYQRVHVLTHADIGDSLAALGRADEAINAWSRALDLSGAVTSDRVRQAMMSIRPLLTTYRRRCVPGASELEHRIRDAVR